MIIARVCVCACLLVPLQERRAATLLHVLHHEEQIPDLLALRALELGHLPSDVALALLHLQGVQLLARTCSVPYQRALACAPRPWRVELIHQSLLSHHDMLHAPVEALLVVLQRDCMDPPLQHLYKHVIRPYARA